MTMKKAALFLALILVTLGVQAGTPWSIVYRDASGAAVSDKLSTLTEATSPASGDWLLLELSTGELRKVDLTNLPFVSPSQAVALSSGTGAPTATPTSPFEIYLDDSDSYYPYFARGTTSAADWTAWYFEGGHDVAIADGGTGQSTRQAAINALTDVANATDEYCYMKDTATGDAVFKACPSGSGGAPVDAQYLVTATDGTLTNAVVVDVDLGTLSLPASTTITSFGASLVSAADATAARTVIGAASSAQGALADTALQDLSDDTTPGLGGDLDGGGHTVSNFRNTINAQTGTTYTAVAADCGRVVTLDNASAITVTLPADSAVGCSTTWVELGAGVVSFTAASGATINNRQSEDSIAGQYGMAFTFVVANSGGSAAAYMLGGDTQ